MVERALLFGKRNRKTDAAKEKRMTGGLSWFTADDGDVETRWSTANDLVSGNGSSNVWVPGSFSAGNFTNQDFLKFCELAFVYGSQSKDMWCGSGFMYYFQLLFEKFLRKSDSDGFFKSKIMVYESPWGDIRLHRHEEMTQSGYTNDAFLSDLNYIGYKHQAGHDVQVETNLQAPGVHTDKEGMYAYIGLNLNFWEAHKWITGLTK